jgi:hypothetical protein
MADVHMTVHGDNGQPLVTFHAATRYELNDLYWSWVREVEMLKELNDWLAMESSEGEGVDTTSDP